MIKTKCLLLLVAMQCSLLPQLCFAQNNGRGERTLVLDLVKLKMMTTDKLNANATPKTTVTELGDKHKWLEVSSTAVGKVNFAGQFPEFKTLSISVKADKLVGNVRVVRKVGLGLSEKLKDGALIISRKLALSEFQLQKNYNALKAKIKAMTSGQFAREYQNQFGTRGGARRGLRDQLLAVQSLELIQRAEKVLVHLKVTDGKKFRSDKFSQHTSLKVIEKYVDGLQVGLESALDFEASFTYTFYMQQLGLSASDYPRSAFTPGKLDQGISEITVSTKISAGSKRVLWFRLPAFLPKQHQLEYVSRPKSWFLKEFESPIVPGAKLIAIVVPKNETAMFIFKWREKNGTGSQLTIRRPEPLKFPY